MGADNSSPSTNKTSSDLPRKPRKFYRRPPFFEENEEFYRLGGLHPVDIDDILVGRYKIFRKLGFGANSTVWLARDEKNDPRRFVALKVVKPVPTGFTSDREPRVLQRLKEAGRPDHPGASHVLHLDAVYSVSGANGEHPVLVFEPTGRSVERFFNAYDVDAPPSPSYHAFMKEICYQMILAVDYLHETGLIHGDIQPGNLLLALQSSLESLSEVDIMKNVPENIRDYRFKLERHDGRPIDKHAPNFMRISQPLDDGYDADAPELPVRVLLSDFQTARFVSEDDGSEDQYPLILAPPESLLDLGLDQKSDIWAIATTTYFLMMRTDLFESSWKDKHGTETETYLPSFIEKLGPLPPDILARWPERDNYVDHKGAILESVLDGEPLMPLHEDISQYKDVTMSDEEAALLEDFVRTALKYRPEERPSTKELLQHPFFQELR